MAESSTILRQSAVMASGTIVSRMSGFVRSALLAAALGNVIHAEVFNIANTIPNMLYILLAGGVINAVLVPQLVRAITHDGDGGEAYTARVLTLVTTFLAAVTVLLVVFAPLVMRIFIDSKFPDEGFDSMVLFARLCLPQVFFYGMFVLVGQILNAHRRFGPMMWAPIANNVISVGVLILYLVVFGTNDPTAPTYSTGEAWLLGLGSTVGIAAQLFVLLPYLRSAGVRLQLRWDLRDPSLAHTLRLGVWTLLFVLVNQIAYWAVVRLASSGTADGGTDGTGYTVYAAAFLIVMVPHSVVTVSLGTAILPRMSAASAEGDRRGMVRLLAPTMRTALSLVVPFAAVIGVVATPMAEVMWGYGAASDTVSNYVPTLILFGPGLVFFTLHYLVLRGFYAREETRTVFFIQCAVAATNILVAVVLVLNTDAAWTTPSLVIAYTVSYAVGSCISYAVLARRLGGLHTPLLARFGARLLIAVGVPLAVCLLLEQVWPWLDSSAGVGLSLVKGIVVGGLFGLGYLAMARALRIAEVSELIDTFGARLRR